MVRTMPLILAFLALATAAQAEEQPVSIKDPKAFALLLREMGYKPDDVTTNNGFPQITVSFADQPTAITFGGCTLAENCTYIVLSSSYSDVKNPPAKWITKMNDKLDLLKVGLNDSNNLYFSATHVIDGVPRSTLRRIIDFWGEDAATLAAEAVKAKLNKGD